MLSAVAAAPRNQLQRPLSLWLRKPVYVYRPSQIVRRLGNARRSGEARVRVAWGDSLYVDTREMIGSSIARLGVHELAVTETIYRLVRAGETAIDVGANLGYHTSLLAHRVGRQGTVHAFEPHPALYARLCDNVGHLRGVRLHEQAISDRDGTAFLNQPDDFARNMGCSSVADRGIPIRVTTIDETIPAGPIGLVKIDIEGHELAALVGGVHALARTLHVVFEEVDPLPTPVSEMLESVGFRVYRIAEAWRGPRLVEPRELRPETQWDAPNYLATREPHVRRLVRPDGWRCLRPRAGQFE
jgi:FkbM family methyltransferase